MEKAEEEGRECERSEPTEAQKHGTAEADSEGDTLMTLDPQRIREPDGPPAPLPTCEEQAEWYREV